MTDSRFSNFDVWIWFEPYVYITLEKNIALLYNTLSGEKLEIKHPLILTLIKTMMKDENQMVHLLDSSNLDSPIIQDFIKKIKSLFMGDTSPVSESTCKPIPFPPIHFLSNFQKIKKIPTIVGKSVLSNLSELVIYINNFSTLNNDIHQLVVPGIEKQFIFSHSTSKNTLTQIDFEHIELVLESLTFSQLEAIHICGGNIFDYIRYHDLVQYMDTYSTQVIYHSIYSDAVDSMKKINSITNSHSQFIIGVPLPIHVKKFEKAVKFSNSRSGVSFEIPIKNEDEFKEAEAIVDLFGLENVQFSPCYTGDNIEFFKDMVFFDKESLLLEKPSQNEIFARMTLNPNDFGKLIILSNGDIHANLNNPKIGNIAKDSIGDVILKELQKGTNWLKTRNDIKPCNRCIYKMLCPPISNYEYVLKRANLCYLHE